MSEALLAARPFRYEKPQSQANKQIVRLARTDRMFAGVQVVRKGGENNLHSHPNMDGFWMVLKGRVRFYGEGDAVLGEFGLMEGMLIPRGFKYWFEVVGEEELELLQFEAFAKSLPPEGDHSGERVNHAPLRPNLDPAQVVITEGSVSS